MTPYNEDLQFFTIGHLAPDLQDVVRPFGDAARYIDEHVPDNWQRRLAMQKLMEAKDCAVRAMILGRGKAAVPKPGSPEYPVAIHGWVVTRPDGTKAECGGPGICPNCQAEQKFWDAVDANKKNNPRNIK